MKNEVFISVEELSNYGEVNNFSQMAVALLNHQKVNWNIAKENYETLKKVKTKNYELNDIYLTAQYNPSRIISTSAKVDKKSIDNRKCFLCHENLPKAQKGIPLKNEYLLLVNPYPIFEQHFTIPSLIHTPQKIDDCFIDLLTLSKELADNFFVFYNGPKCGASAPDHLHFQAGLKNSTPLDKNYSFLLKRGNQLVLNNDMKVTIVSEKIFKFICIQSKDSEKIVKQFKKILSQLRKIENTLEEPLLNIICLYENDQWNLFVIPRKKHRPIQFFAEDETKLLISPASADLAGLLITPREEDFNKLTLAEIEDIYSQVLHSADILSVIVS